MAAVTATPEQHREPSSPGAEPATRTMAVIGYGFIGRRIARAARARGWRVRTLTPVGVPSDVPHDLEVVVGSAQDPVAARVLDGVQHVVYAAGTAKPADSNREPMDDAVRNLEPLLAILDAVTSRGVEGFTFLSSGGTVYGPDAHVPTPEDAPLWPISSYGIMKIAAERYVAMYARRAGFAADLLRCANVFGPGEPTTGSQGLIGIARDRLLSGRPIMIFGDGSARRDYIHVDELSDTVVRLAERMDGVRVLNVGSGDATSITDIVTALSSAHGIRPVLEHRPSRPSDSPIAQLDVSRLRATLDFHPRPTVDWLTQPPEDPRD